MKNPNCGFLLSMAGVVQLLMATAHAQTPAAPAPPAQPAASATPATSPAPAETPSSPPSAVVPPAPPPTEIPAAPAAAAPTPPPAPPRPPARPFPTVTVIADSNKAVLEKMQAGDWELSCWAPCRRGQDPGQTYRVAGRGLYPSDPFSLPGGTQQVEIKAHMGAKAARVGGTAMIIGGLASVALNGIQIVVANDSSTQMPIDKGPLHAGLVLGGAVALFGLLILGGSSTKVAVQDHLSPPDPVE